MAKVEEIIYNLGSSHLSACKFLKREGKLYLESFDFKDLSEASVSEDSWISEIETILHDLSRSTGLKGEANFILPGNMVLSKTLRVPKVELEKQRKVVAFELSQKMPFPLENLIWDFLVIDDDGIEQEILSFAIKPEVVEKVIKAIYRCGIIPKLFTPGPALDYHSLQDTDSIDKTEDSLCINFGAKTTNLTFLSKSGYLLRSLSFGGNQLTESIASAFGINYPRAEELKLKDSIGELALNEADPSFATFQVANENFLNKYMQEISRSIVTYKRLKKGKLPAQLIITGRTIKAKGLVESLGQSQQLPINYFDPYSQIDISESIDKNILSTLPFIGSEVIGLAKELINLKDQQLLNLMPLGKAKQLESKKRLPWLVVLSIVLSFMPLPWYLNLLNNEDLLVKQLADISKDIVISSKELDETTTKNKDLYLTQKLNQKASARIRELHSLSKQAFILQDFINQLQSLFDPSLNHNAWIDDLQFLSKNTTINNSKYKQNTNNIDVITVKITGRYLVKLTAPKLKMSEDERKLALLEKNGQRQENITNAFSTIKRINKINKKIFSIEGKGDLYNRQFTHFEIELELNLK
jgi:type IV pilus assembly protein PilM